MDLHHTVVFVLTVQECVIVKCGTNKTETQEKHKYIYF